MPESEPNARQTLALLFGASTFRRAPKLAQGRAFYNSAWDFHEYLKDSVGLGLPPENINWLFDDSRSQSDLLQDIRDFLEDRSTALKNEGLPPQDLIVYYVGHGLFAGADQTYCFAVRATDERSEGLTSIRATDLASIIKGSARFLRKFLILDCCFSAAAYKEFQSGPLTAGRVKLLDELPLRGTTLLCSASARDASLAPQGLSCTMFSNSLLKALREGHPNLGSRLSLSELGDLVKMNLKEAYPNDWVRPEVHSPDQREGDVASVPLFPNMALGRRREKVEPRKIDETTRADSGATVAREKPGSYSTQAEEERQKAEGQKKREEEAQRTAKRAGRHADAISFRSVLFTAGRGQLDSHQYVQVLENAATAGDITAMLLLGMIYEQSRGVAGDNLRASQWYEKAANLGNAEAMCDLGYLYERGFGVMQDYQQAIRWYQKAAALGNIDAMSNLGYLYETGQGVPKDQQRAREWYDKANVDRRSMKILFLASNPFEQLRLDLEAEERSLREALKTTKYRDSIQLVVRQALQPDDLIVHVRDEKPNIIHFSGHGSPNGIILRNDKGQLQAVSGEAFRQFLRGRGIDLVVLNSCYSQPQADAIESVVTTVVGTTEALDDEAARRFTVAFYRSLGNGLSISEAFRDGRDAVSLHALKDVFQSRGDLNYTFFPGQAKGYGSLI